MNHDDLEARLKQEFEREPLPERDYSALFAQVKAEPPGFWQQQLQQLKTAYLSAAVFFALGFGLSIVLSSLQPNDPFIFAEADTTRPMQDAVGAYQLYQAFSQPEYSGDQQEVLAWFDQSVRHHIEVPDLAAVGFELRGVRPIASPFGAAILLAYHKEGEAPLVVFMRQDDGQRPDDLLWREEQQLNIAYFYSGDMALAVTHVKRELLQQIAPALYRRYG